jgi:hypothetical protein
MEMDNLTVEVVYQAVTLGRYKPNSRCTLYTLKFCNRPPLWSSGQSSWLHNGDVLCFL